MKSKLMTNMHLVKVKPQQGRPEREKDEKAIEIKNKLKQICLDCNRPNCEHGICAEYRVKRDEILHTR